MVDGVNEADGEGRSFSHTLLPPYLSSCQALHPTILSPRSVDSPKERTDKCPFSSSWLGMWHLWTASIQSQASSWLQKVSKSRRQRQRLKDLNKYLDQLVLSLDQRSRIFKRFISTLSILKCNAPWSRTTLFSKVPFSISKLQIGASNGRMLQSDIFKSTHKLAYIFCWLPLHVPRTLKLTLSTTSLRVRH